MEHIQKKKLNTRWFQRVIIGLGVWLPIIAVFQVYSLIVGWLDMPARGIAHIPFLNHLFERVPILHALQQLFSVALVSTLVVAVLFLTGTIVMKKAGKKLRYVVETHLLSLLPLYNFFKKIVARFGGENGDVPFFSRFERPVFVHIFNSQTFQTGMLTAGSDHRDSGICTVCVPPAPNVFAGSIYNVPVEYVHILKMQTSEVVSAVAAWGVGTEELIARYVTERVASGAVESACALGEHCPIEQEVRKAFLRERQEMQT